MNINWKVLKTETAYPKANRGVTKFYEIRRKILDW